MVRKDIENDSDRPHYYSQFWLDIAAGRRVIGQPKPDEETEIADSETASVAPRRTRRSSLSQEDSTYFEPADEEPEVAANADVEANSAEALLDTELADFGEDGAAEPEEEEYTEEDAAEVPEVENSHAEEEEEFFDEEEDEEDEEDLEWGGRGRKKSKPTRPVKPRKTRREPRRGF